VAGPLAALPEPVPIFLVAMSPTIATATTKDAPMTAFAESDSPRAAGAPADIRPAATGMTEAAIRAIRDWPHLLHQSALSARRAPQDGHVRPEVASGLAGV
jgi:hypothetical protein